MSSIGKNPASPADITTDVDLTSSKPSALAQPTTRSLTPREQLIRSVNSGLLTFLVVLIALLWSVPTFGLFISSFRPPAAIHSTGWWEGLAPPWHFTLENYQNVLKTQDLRHSLHQQPDHLHSGDDHPSVGGRLRRLCFRLDALSWARLDLPGDCGAAGGANSDDPDPYSSDLLTDVGLTGSFIGIWLAHTAYGLPFAIYLLRSFFGALPGDLMESARIDGASHLRIFFRILLPLAVPSLASLVIFQFMWVWNDLLVALVLLGGAPDHAPMTVAIANLVNSFGTNYEVLTAAAFISMALPLVIFFSLQRYFVRGILAGSVKG